MITFASGRAWRISSPSSCPARRAAVASLGPMTSRALRDAGWTVDVEAPLPTSTFATRRIARAFRPRQKVLNRLARATA